MNGAFRGSSTSLQHLLATIRHAAGQWIETGATNLDRLLASNSVVISCFARVGRAFTIILYPLVRLSWGASLYHNKLSPNAEIHKRFAYSRKKRRD